MIHFCCYIDSGNCLKLNEIYVLNIYCVVHCTLGTLIYHGLYNPHKKDPMIIILSF